MSADERQGDSEREDGTRGAEDERERTDDREGTDDRERSDDDFSWLEKESPLAETVPELSPPALLPASEDSSESEAAAAREDAVQDEAARQARERWEREARKEVRRDWEEMEQARRAREEQPEREEPAARREVPDDAGEIADEVEGSDETSEVDRLAAAAEATRRRQEVSQAEVKRDFELIVKEVEQHRNNGYDLIGLVGYPQSGKTHFLRALSLALKTQSFEVGEWSKLRRSRVPVPTEAEVFYYPVSRRQGEKWVFVDAGGELYARLSINDWQLADDSAGLLHSLQHCRGLFLLLHLQPGHFRLGSTGTHRWMSDEERQQDEEMQVAQEELEFFDSFLLFLRALIATGGKVDELAVRCAAEGLDTALRPYRDQAPRLGIPVQVLFTQADKYAAGDLEVAEAISLSPRKTTVGVAPFVARHLPTLLATMLEHAERFRFDFVQSYEEKRVFAADGSVQHIPEWSVYGDGEPLSCGALPSLEFLVRNLPAKGFLERWCQAREIGTRRALRLDRWLRRRLWRDVEFPL